jgi:hypothetical protein
MYERGATYPIESVGKGVLPKIGKNILQVFAFIHGKLGCIVSSFASAGAVFPST